MKILVFDDSAVHRKAAAVLLKGHDLTIVGTYDEAEELLTPQFDWKKSDALLKTQFGDFNPYRSDDEAKKAEYFAAEKVAREQATTHPDFDVVLTDLLVPASAKAQGQRGARFVGQEMPLGTVIALRALAVGVKKVAVVTDTNHHDHPASATFDHFPVFTVGDAMVLCGNSNVTTLVDAETFEEVTYTFLRTPEGKEKYPEQPDGTYKGTVRAKAWNWILGILNGEEYVR